MVIRTMPSGIREMPSPFQSKPKVADDFYNSVPWRTLMKSIISTRGRRCEECGRTGCRVFGDHIHELKDGGAALDPTNIMVRCGSCHTTKTQINRALRLGSVRPMMPVASRQR